MQFVSHLRLDTEPSVSLWINTDARNSISLGNSVKGSVDRCVSSHQHLYLEGDVQSHIYVVTSGVICTYNLLSDGRRQIMAFAYPGDILGVECGERYLHHAEALSESIVKSIPASVIDRLIMNEPGFGQTLLRITALELARTREQLLSLGRRTAAEKLATFLLNIACRDTSSSIRDVQFDLPMKRCEIADYLGLTVETISRNFTRLKQAGIIELLSSNKIRVSDVNLLEAAARGNDSGMPAKIALRH